MPSRCRRRRSSAARPGAYVYVINADNTVSVRQITTSAVDNNHDRGHFGLSAGERVVIDGTDRLRDGLEVIVTIAGRQAGQRGANDRSAGQTRRRRPASYAVSADSNAPP